VIEESDRDMFKVRVLLTVHTEGGADVDFTLYMRRVLGIGDRLAFAGEPGEGKVLEMGIIGTVEQYFFEEIGGEYVPEPETVLDAVTCGRTDGTVTRDWVIETLKRHHVVIEEPGE
jgi:hypothetical protein